MAVLVLSKVKLPCRVCPAVTVRLGMVTKPVPKVTGRLVTVLMDKVVAVVKSITGLDDAIFVVTLFNVTTPVPVLNALLPVIVVAPFKETAPVPVPKVLAPVWLKVAATVTVPLAVKPEVAVMSPEIVGVAVQVVGLTVKVVAAFPRLVAVELVAPKFRMPAESTAMVPEVAVEMVKLPAVLVQDEVPPLAITKAPVELPILVAAVPVALILVVPVMVAPPVP